MLKKAISILLIAYPIIVLGLIKLGISHSVIFAVFLVAIGGMIYMKQIPRGFVFTFALIAILVSFYNTKMDLVRLTPLMLSSSFLLLFINSQQKKIFLFAEITRKFRNIDDKELIRLNRSNIFWVFGVSINSLILLYFMFQGSNEQWAFYASVGSYILFGVILFLQIIYVVGFKGLAQDMSGVFGKIIYFINHTYNFSIFGLMCILATPIFGMMYLIYGGATANYRRTVQKICYGSFNFVIWHTKLYRLIEVKFIDLSKIHAPLIVCNHLCMFDIVAVFSKFLYCTTFVNMKFVKNPLLKPMISACGHIPLDPQDPNSCFKAFCTAEAYLKSGSPFVVFPEGTRSKTGVAGKLKEGVFKLALESGVDITPVFFTMNKPFLKGGPMYSYKLGMVKLYGYIMPPILIKDFTRDRKGVTALKIEYQRLLDEFLLSNHTMNWNRNKTSDYISINSSTEGSPA